MNVGAVTSLTGFMMSDILYLRTLSVFGSLCGVTYNATRQPMQKNGMLWGFFFIAVNSFMVRVACVPACAWLGRLMALGRLSVCPCVARL